MQDTLTRRQLQSLIHVSNVINTTLDIDTIIDSIMIETISVVDAAGGGSLWLYDEELDCIVAQSAQGLFYPHIFRQIRLKSGESMTGSTFAAKSGQFFPNEEKIKEMLDTLSPYNRDLLRKSIPNNFRFTSVICSPILLKGQCIGVITLDSFQQSLHFKQEDINLLEAICHQAAIALEKSSLYREKEATVHKLSHSLKIHRNLADQVMNGEGLQSIINYIHQTFGEHTLLFDELGELIASAYDSSLSNEMIQFLKLQTSYMIGSLGNSHSVTEIELGEEFYQLVTLSLGSKSKPLGILILLSKQKMGEVDIAALEHACTVISLELVKEQAVLDTQQRLRGELVTKLFSGQMNESIIHKAKNLNFDPNRSYIVAMINFKANSPNQCGDSLIKRLLQVANHVFLENNPQGTAVRNENQIVVLMSFNPHTASSTIVGQIKELAKSFRNEMVLKKIDTEISIGIGGVKQGLIYVHKSFIEATNCLKFIDKYQFEDNVLSYTDLGVQRFILQNSEEELMDFVNEVLGALIDYENSRKGELLTTLFVYLEQNQNIRKTAEIIHVHINTLTYRLKRIEDILLINLSDSKQLFNIHLAINIYQYIKDKIAMQLQEN